MIIALLLALVTPAALVAPTIAAPPAAASVSGDELSHLPGAIRADIERWRSRLASAKCLKLVVDTEETWTNLGEFVDGRPRVVRRERMRMHVWMTPDMLWLTLLDYDGDELDVQRPHYQMLWDGGSHLVRERWWVEDSQTYRARRYISDEAFGPGEAPIDSRGCVYGSVLQSWLAGGESLADRNITVRSVGLLRTPNLAVVPPSAAQGGVWLDVFDDEIQRDESRDGDGLYRRHDLMLLSSETGQPEVREWRTIVLADSGGDGHPQEIFASRRFSYSFYDSLPSEQDSSIKSFAHEIDQLLER